MAAFLFLLLLSLPFSAQSKLSLNYYAKTCPNFPQIILDAAKSKQSTAPTTAAATLRLLTADCLVAGCDASILVSSNLFNTAERDADLNLSIPGDAFDLIARAKLALELSCPGIVSCADVLAQATRDLVAIAGGPSYAVRLGRKDGLVSKASSAIRNVPNPNHSIDESLSLLTAKGFTIRETVALYGGRTIGFSNCKEFSGRIFNFSRSAATDPAMDPEFAAVLKRICGGYEKNPGMSAYSDAVTPVKFDNQYYRNLLRGLALSAADQALATDPRTRKFVEMYAGDQALFFRDFGHAMEKMSVREVKTGRKGEVRRKCDAINTI